MPRKPRVFVEGGIYHVFSRVTRREPVFKDQKVAEVFRDTCGGEERYWSVFGQRR